MLTSIQLLPLLTKNFSDSELRDLCFYLDVDYENLRGEGKSAKARELITYLERRGRLADLIRVGQEQRPDISWGTPLPTQSTPTRTPSSPTRILFLAANPSGTAHLRLDQEIRAVDQALRQTDYRDQFELEQQWAVRVTDLQGTLLRYKPDIVHFSGHGETEGILLENASGKSQLVSSEALGLLFSILKDNIRCVVLNACYSEHQAHAIAEHIPCVVGMSSTILDQSAMSFATAFYQALGYGRDVKTAFDLGRAQIHMENLREKDKPQMLVQKGNAGEIVFVKK